MARVGLGTQCCVKRARNNNSVSSGASMHARAHWLSFCLKIWSQRFPFSLSKSFVIGSVKFSASSLFLPHGRTGTWPVRTSIRVIDILWSLIDHFGKITDLINCSDVSRTIFLSRFFLALQEHCNTRTADSSRVVIPLFLSF